MLFIQSYFYQNWFVLFVNDPFVSFIGQYILIIHIIIVLLWNDMYWLFMMFIHTYVNIFICNVLKIKINIYASVLLHL